MACSKVNLPIVIVNPAHIRKFEGALGQLAKTDKLDAQLIAHYGEAMQPPVSVLKPEKFIDECDEVKAKNDIIQSMPGVGKVVANSLVSNMPELDFISNKHAAALVGEPPRLIERAVRTRVSDEYEEVVIR
jgi:transposase